MSTKMYNYRVRKEDWWVLFEEVRAFYLQEHPMMEMLRRYVETQPSAHAAYRLLDELGGDESADWTARLQLFDEGATFLVRPLERGYFFLNNHDKWPAAQPVFYDDRSDVAPEDEPNKVVAEWVDQQIDQHRYFVVDLLTQNDMRDLAWNTMARSKVAES